MPISTSVSCVLKASINSIFQLCDLPIIILTVTNKMLSQGDACETDQQETGLSRNYALVSQVLQSTIPDVQNSISSAVYPPPDASA